MRLAALLAAAVLGLCATGGARATEAGNALLRARVAALAAGQRVEVAGEELVSRAAVPRVYAATGLRLLWQDPARLGALLAAIRGAAEDGLQPRDYHLRALTQLASASDRGADADLLATDAYVMLISDLYLGKVDPVAIEPNWNLAPRPLRERQALEFVIEAISSGEIAAGGARVRPQHWLYEYGRAALARYREIERAGGWGELPNGPKLEPGASGARVPALRRRLATSGDYLGADSDSPRYDDALVASVRVFQRRHLLTADGEVGAPTLHELNVPVAARIDQLRVNLERGRWVLNEIGDGDLLVVDIAGYGVRYLRDRKVIWRARAIVGRTYRQTPMFRAEIENIVFNPTWTVPPGILAKDVFPGMQRGNDVLAHKHLRVFDRSGAPVEPSLVDWSDYDARRFPYVLRQDAGEDNALGRVKINFPNPYFVYLHDTPTRSLFDRSQRTFSSGCIRIERPLELVELLLADPARWDAAAIRAAVDAGTTRTVLLPRTVPVLLIYWTADADPDGHVVFKRDVYGRDARLLRALDRRLRSGRRPPA
jgi:murein L,D-transpeptidase YcbB/YkuD